MWGQNPQWTLEKDTNLSSGEHLTANLESGVNEQRILLRWSVEELESLRIPESGYHSIKANQRTMKDITAAKVKVTPN